MLRCRTIVFVSPRVLVEARRRPGVSRRLTVGKLALGSKGVSLQSRLAQHSQNCCDTFTGLDLPGNQRLRTVERRELHVPAEDLLQIDSDHDFRCASSGPTRNVTQTELESFAKFSLRRASWMLTIRQAGRYIRDRVRAYPSSSPLSKVVSSTCMIFT